MMMVRDGWKELPKSGKTAIMQWLPQTRSPLTSCAFFEPIPKETHRNSHLSTARAIRIRSAPEHLSLLIRDEGAVCRDSHGGRHFPRKFLTRNHRGFHGRSEPYPSNRGSGQIVWWTDCRPIPTSDKRIEIRPRVAGKNRSVPREVRRNRRLASARQQGRVLPFGTERNQTHESVI